VPAWTIEVPKAGRYRVDLSYGSSSDSTEFEIAASSNASTSKTIRGKFAKTAYALVFRTDNAGTIDLPAGEVKIQVKADAKGAVNLEKIVLTPVAAQP